MVKQAGEGKLGCIVTLFLLFVFGFVCFRSIPVMLDKMDVEDQLERIVSEAGSRNSDPDAIRVQVADLIKNKQFLTTPEDLHVLKGAGRGGDVRISVKYWRDVDFLAYTHTFRFQSDVKSFIGTL